MQLIALCWGGDRGIYTYYIIGARTRLFIIVIVVSR